MDDDAIRWGSALLETLTPIPADAPLLLSGGMDSMTLLAGLLKLERKPLCIAYRLGTRVSNDLVAARKVTDLYGLKLVEVPIPDDDESLVRDVREVLEWTQNPRKTAVQCCHVLMYLIRGLPRSAGYAITGAGGIVEDNRHAQVMGAAYETPEIAEKLETRRRKNLLNGDPTSATETMKRAAARWDFHLYEPYSMQPLADVGLSIPFPEMNQPRQKGIALRAFPGFHGNPEHPTWWRPNSSLQVDGGIRDLHERLLGMPEINRFHQRVVAVYRDLLRESTNATLF